ncbi:MAG: cell division protein ZapA [bacterium]|jgi:cell division protein ZapA (FtsZ GTPase activity inhibitor)
MLVSDSELKQYQINIQGNRFAISSPYGEEHIRQVERFLEAQIQTVREQAGLTGGTQTLVLAALNITDELLKLKQSESSHHQRLEAACEQLERALRPG